MWTTWLVAWYSGRTLVFGRRTPVCPALDLQLTGDHLCG